MTTQELIEKAKDLKGSDIETLGRFAFENLFEIIATLKKYREALERLARLGNGNEYGNSLGNEIAQKALED